MCDSAVGIPAFEPPKMLKISVDFDDTITAAPDLWFRLMCIMDKAGHDVRIVTARFDHPDLNLDIKTFLLGAEDSFPVIYCGGIQKAAKCSSVGWEPDIWIDDSPEVIPKPTSLVERVKELGLV